MKKKMLASFALVAALSSLTACSSATEADSSPSGSGVPEITSLKVGVIPFAELAAFYIAIDRGLFEDEGLTVEPTQATGGATIITSLIAGNINFAYSNYVSVLQAASKGLPLQIVRENDRPGAQAIYALPDSGIANVEDLAGKTIAVNSLGNIMELTSRAVLEANGVDLDTVEFVEIPPPNMNAALEQGQIDAAWLVEPFITLAKQTLDVHIAAEVFDGPTKDLPVAGWVTTDQFAAENPNTVAAFTRAIDAAIQITLDDPQSVKDIMPTYTEIPDAVVADMSEIAFAPDNDLAKLTDLQRLMIDFGYYDQALDLDELMVPSAGE